MRSAVATLSAAPSTSSVLYLVVPSGFLTVPVFCFQAIERGTARDALKISEHSSALVSFVSNRMEKNSSSAAGI